MARSTAHKGILASPLSGTLALALRHVAEHRAWKPHHRSLLALERRGLAEQGRDGRWHITNAGQEWLNAHSKAASKPAPGCIPRPIAHGAQALAELAAEIRDPSIHPVQPAPFTTLEIAVLVKTLTDYPSPGDPLMYRAFKGAMRKLNDALEQKGATR